MKTKILKYVLSTFMMIYTLPLWANPDFPPSQEDPEYQEAPIDEFLPWLLFIGLLLGMLMKMRNKPDTLKD